MKDKNRTIISFGAMINVGEHNALSDSRSQQDSQTPSLRLVIILYERFSKFKVQYFLVVPFHGLSDDVQVISMVNATACKRS